MSLNGMKLVILYLYEHKGRSQQYLAAKFGVHVSTVYDWINQSDKIKAENKDALSLHLYAWILSQRDTK